MLFFFFNDTATTEIYTLSLHDALPIYHGREVKAPGNRVALGSRCGGRSRRRARLAHRGLRVERSAGARRLEKDRSEEHTSELQSQSNLVCRLLLEKKKR